MRPRHVHQESRKGRGEEGWEAQGTQRERERERLSSASFSSFSFSSCVAHMYDVAMDKISFGEALLQKRGYVPKSKIREETGKEKRKEKKKNQGLFSACHLITNHV